MPRNQVTSDLAMLIQSLRQLGWGEWEALVSPGPPVLALPGEEERSCADIDILVGAGQAPAVLLQVVPGILVEMGHLVGERGSETGWNLSPMGLRQALRDVTGTKPGDSSREWVTSMRKKLVQRMYDIPLGHLATRVKLRAQEGASLPPPSTSKCPGLKARVSKVVCQLQRA